MSKSKIASWVIVGGMLAVACQVSGQSSSLYQRGQQGQCGSNQPNVVVVVVESPAPLPGVGEPARTAGGQPPGSGPGPGAATATPPAGAEAGQLRPAADAQPLPAGTGQPAPARSAVPAPAGRGQAGGGQVPGYPVAGGPNRLPAVSPAAAALQRLSFTAIALPEPRQFQVHDLITIIVREETSFASDGATDLEKKYSFDAKLEKWIQLRVANLQVVPTSMADGTPQLKGKASRAFEGDGEVKRKDTFIGRLTAEVLDVKPNGTMVLVARKHIKTDEEEQAFEVTGTCRAQDVTADNTVLSTQLADLTVRKTHRGAVRDTTRRGIVPWLVDKVNPW